MPGGNSSFRGVIRVFRGAPLSTGLAGQLAFDQVSSGVVEEALSLENGTITSSTYGMACVQLKLQFTGLALLSGIRIIVTRSPQTDRQFIADDSTFRSVATVGQFSISHCARFDVAPGDTIRVDVSPVGVGSVSYVPGDSATWCAVVVV